MRRIVLTVLTALVWLIASPSLQLRDAAWVEVGATPAAAQEYKGIMVDEQGAKPADKKSVKKTKKKRRVGSSGIVTSNQPGKYPMQQITPPQIPSVTSGVTMPAQDPR
jgi:hypothetical protein